LGGDHWVDKGFKPCVARSIDIGDLPIAVAACAEMRRLGDDPAEELDLIASAFASGSPRVSGAPLSPPALPGHVENPQPWPENLVGSRLLAEAERALEEAQRAGHQRSRMRLAPQLLFSSLRFKALRALIAAFDLRKAVAAESIIEQGSIGAEAYV